MVPKFKNTVRANQNDVDRFQAGLSDISGAAPSTVTRWTDNLFGRITS